jgi:hypothetical protein
MYKIYISLFVILLLSCSIKIRYIGKSLPPTKSIDVFISEKSIKRPFEYIGKGYIGGFGFIKNQNTIQRKAEHLAREKGADAVLIIDYYIPNTGGTNITSVFRTDSIGRGTVITGNTSISPTTSSGYNILFLKYNR